MSKEKCVKCVKGGTKDIMNCAICGDMYHFKCLATDPNILSTVCVDPNLFWFCNNCLTNIKTGIQGLVEIRKMHEDLAQSQKLASEQYGKMKCDIEKTNAEVKELCGKITEIETVRSQVLLQINENEARMKDSWAEVVKGEVKKNVDVLAEEVRSTKISLNKVVDEIKSDVETINREGNVVVFRLNESSDTNAEDARKKDKKTIIDVFSTITDGLVKESDVKTVYRLGPLVKDTVRPLMVKFRSKMIKNMIMENRSKLSRLGDNIKNIGFGDDLTREQRQIRKTLVAEAREKQSQDSGEYIYRVRGDPANMRIIRLKKR